MVTVHTRLSRSRSSHAIPENIVIDIGLEAGTQIHAGPSPCRPAPASRATRSTGRQHLRDDFAEALDAELAEADAEPETEHPRDAADGRRDRGRRRRA